ncbi:hypothetical protein ACET3Z_013276 [Daucus carota]
MKSPAKRRVPAKKQNNVVLAEENQEEHEDEHVVEEDEEKHEEEHEEKHKEEHVAADEKHEEKHKAMNKEKENILGKQKAEYGQLFAYGNEGR